MEGQIDTEESFYCAQIQRESTLDVSISNNCDLEARGIAPPTHTDTPPVSNLLTAESDQSQLVLGVGAQG